MSSNTPSAGHHLLFHQILRHAIHNSSLLLSWRSIANPSYGCQSLQRCTLLIFYQVLPAHHLWEKHTRHAYTHEDASPKVCSVTSLEKNNQRLRKTIYQIFCSCHALNPKSWPYVLRMHHTLTNLPQTSVLPFGYFILIWIGRPSCLGVPCFSGVLQTRLKCTLPAPLSDRMQRTYPSLQLDFLLQHEILKTFQKLIISPSWSIPMYTWEVINQSDHISLLCNRWKFYFSKYICMH